MVAHTLVPLLLPALAFAQHIGGTVAARETGQPIAAAMVQLVAPDSTVLRTALTDQNGRFAFPTDGCGPPGGYLFVMRIGYRALRASLTALPDDCTSWSITLEDDPVRMPALTVKGARNRDLERVGFYSRKQIGLGTFVDRETLETRYGTQSRTAEVLQRVPGVFRVEQTFNSAIVYLRPQPGMEGPGCAAAIYIDGLFLQRELPRLAATDVEALEIYRGPAQVPAQYGGASAACGVVLIWTRTGAGR